MNHLEQATKDLEHAIGQPRVDWIQLAIAHTLIALVERLDALTDTHTFANGEEIKSIRLVAATFAK